MILVLDSAHSDVALEIQHFLTVMAVKAHQ